MMVSAAFRGRRGAAERRELFLWLACLLLANQILRVPASSLSGFIDGLLPALASKSAFYYLGWYAVLRLLFHSGREAAPSAADIAFALAIATLNFLPDYNASWVSATAVGICLLTTNQGDRKLRAAGVVLLALAVNGLWGPFFFDVFAIQLLRVDAALVGAALSLTQPNVSWHETVIEPTDGPSLFIAPPCSSFHNVSLALLCWVSLNRLCRTRWMASDTLIALAVAGAVILLNGCRLYLMAMSPSSLAYWHEGFGEEIFAWTTTFVVLVISLWGAVRKGRT